MLLYWLAPHGLLSFLSHSTEDYIHVHRGSTAHSELGSDTSVICQENTLQACSQANLAGEGGIFSTDVSSSQMTLDCGTSCHRFSGNFPQEDQLGLCLRGQESQLQTFVVNIVTHKMSSGITAFMYSVQDVLDDTFLMQTNLDAFLFLSVCLCVMKKV